MPKKLKINLDLCHHEIVHNTASELGFIKTESEDEDFKLIWSDRTLPLERIITLRPHQRCNHFVGTPEIARKDNLGKNLARMIKAHPKEYDFFPRTWTLPGDFSAFRAEFDPITGKPLEKNATFIVKPEASSQGKGIFLTRNLNDIDPMGHIIVQDYIAKPLLIENKKVDLRIYVLVSSCDPLRIYLYKDGLARFCTSDYVAPQASNMKDAFVHLTNYSINKNSDNFVEGDGSDGSKRSVNAAFDILAADGYSVDEIWNEISDVVIKTMLSVQPKQAHLYRTCFANHSTPACFELLGFDIMLKRVKAGQAKAMLIEVNLSPSMNSDTPWDRIIKRQLLMDIFNIVSPGSVLKKAQAAEKAKGRSRLTAPKNKTDSERAQERLEQEELQRKFDEFVEQVEDRRAKKTNFVKIYPCADPAKTAAYEALKLPYEVPATMASKVRHDSIQRQLGEQQRKQQLAMTKFKSRPAPKRPDAAAVEIVAQEVAAAGDVDDEDAAAANVDIALRLQQLLSQQPDEPQLQQPAVTRPVAVAGETRLRGRSFSEETEQLRERVQQFSLSAAKSKYASTNPATRAAAAPVAVSVLKQKRFEFGSDFDNSPRTIKNDSSLPQILSGRQLNAKPQPPGPPSYRGNKPATSPRT